MARISQLIGGRIKYAIDNQDCESLESEIERYFDMIRGVLKDVRKSVAEEVTACQ